MKRVLAFIIACMLMISCCFAEGFDTKAEALNIASSLTSGRYSEIIAAGNEVVRSAISEEMLAQTWQTLQLQMGAFKAIGSAEADESARTARVTLVFESGSLSLNIAFDAQNLISALVLQPIAEPVVSERPLPEGASESEIFLFEGTDIQLEGRIVRPENDSADTPYIIFAQGSGPSDMDETIGPNKPFRDVAYDLAALGIGSLRFDKITYAHPGHPIQTVAQEYLEPLQEAMRVLRQETAASEIYLAGHSLGGMIAPWLVRECGFSGGISFAGTPKTLWEISYAQNLLTLEYLPEEQRIPLMEQIESERARAEKLPDMNEEELNSAVIFGISAVYQRAIADLDQAAIAKETGKPFLFLWGDKDFQVDKSAFSEWKDRLGSEGPFSYIVYEGLNHLFMPAGESESILNAQAAYSRPAAVSEKVSADIAEWINQL